MQALVYIFIALASACVGGLAYFGLTFTPANAILAAVVFGSVCVLAVERTLRVRTERRLERAIEELSRLLATDAQAGAVLGQRINTLTDLNPGQRLDTVEADISVLGTVIRQVAEAVADMEERVTKAQPIPAYDTIGTPPPAPAIREPEPIIPADMVRKALKENRLVHHIQPVLRLPQRRAAAFDLTPRLVLEKDAIAVPADFMPRRDGNDVLRQVEYAGLVEALTIARRSRNGGPPPMLNVPLSRASLDDTSAEQLLITLEGHREVSEAISFLFTEAEWFDLNTRERGFIAAFARKGVTYTVSNLRSLRVDVATMSEMGVRSVRVDASQFIDSPQTYTDFHLNDVAAYLSRHDIMLVATGVVNEKQIVELLDNDIVLVQGDHLAKAGSIRSDLTLSSGRATRAV